MHYTQAGVYEGSLTIGGRTFTELIGMRDRSWGIRDMARVPFWVWISAQFESFCISAWLWETPDGEVIHADGALIRESGEVRPVTKIEHELELRPRTKRPKVDLSLYSQRRSTACGLGNSECSKPSLSRSRPRPGCLE